MRYLRRTLVLLVASAGLALPTSALASGFRARLQIGTHTPKVGLQSIKVTATRNGHKLSGTVKYQFLYNGTVVSTQPGGRFRHGVYRDKLDWPRRAVGHRITLQVVAKTRYGTDRLRWWIRVCR